MEIPERWLALAAICLVILLCLVARPVWASPFTCKQVRSYVAQHGKVSALAFAIKNGATWAEIKEAKKCLR